MASNVTAFRPNPRVYAPANIDRHFNIVVAGEFNSGKSAVVNLLLRKDILPTSVGYSQMPPLRIFPSDKEAYNILSASNDLVDSSEYKRGVIHGTSVRSARVEMPLDDFAGAVITEVSVGQHGELEPEAEAIMRSADLLIWCTMGQRAWCLTEITVIEKMPKEILSRAILAVSRSDYLKNEDDREKVRTRLEREAKQYFNRIVMLDASNKSIRAAKDDNKWNESGGRLLFDGVMSEFSTSEFYGKTRPVAELQEIHSFRSEASEAVEHVKTSLTINDIAAAWQLEISGVEEWIADNEDASELAVARFVFDRIRLFASSVLADHNKPHEDWEDLYEFFQKSGDVIEGSVNSGKIDGSAMFAVELALQLEEELVSKCK